LKAAAIDAYPMADALLRNPIIGIGCCACAANGHAAAPPRIVMNSRRLMAPPPAVDHGLGRMTITQWNHVRCPDRQRAKARRWKRAWQAGGAVAVRAGLGERAGRPQGGRYPLPSSRRDGAATSYRALLVDDLLRLQGAAAAHGLGMVDRSSRG